MIKIQTVLTYSVNERNRFDSRHTLFGSDGAQNQGQSPSRKSSVADFLIGGKNMRGRSRENFSRFASKEDIGLRFGKFE